MQTQIVELTESNQNLATENEALVTQLETTEPEVGGYSLTVLIAVGAACCMVCFVLNYFCNKNDQEKKANEPLLP